MTAGPDIFEQFDRKGKREPLEELDTEDEQVGDPRVYEAFRASRRQFRLLIRPAKQAWERVSYRYLLHIMENSDLGTHVTLVFTFMVVTLEGHNLRMIADAIDKEACRFVQEYDQLRFDRPTDKTAPFIEKITVYAGADMNAVLQPQAKVKTKDAVES